MSNPSLFFPPCLGSVSVLVPFRPLLPPLESWGGAVGSEAVVLPEGVQVLGFLLKPVPGVFVGARVSQGWACRASQAAWPTSSVTATSRRGGARVIKTEEATLFSGLEAMISEHLLLGLEAQGLRLTGYPTGPEAPFSLYCTHRYTQLHWEQG